MYVCNKICMSDVCMSAMESTCIIYMYVMYVCNKICMSDVCM